MELAYSEPIASFRLSGPYLITGGTRGLGRAISVQFARAGARVIANYLRNTKAAGELKSLAEEQHLSIDLCRADLTVPEGLNLIDAAIQESGKSIVGLVHCAATGTHRPFSELTSRHLTLT